MKPNHSLISSFLETNLEGKRVIGKIGVVKESLFLRWKIKTIINGLKREREGKEKVIWGWNFELGKGAKMAMCLRN